MVVNCGCCGNKLSDKVSECCGADIVYSEDGTGNQYTYCEDCNSSCRCITAEEYKQILKYGELII